MKRGIITNNGQGIHISDGEVWMTAWEIADLFYTTAGANTLFINVAVCRRGLPNALPIFQPKCMMSMVFN